MTTDFLKYLYRSHNLHGVHSPAIYNLNRFVFNKRCEMVELENVNRLRSFLKTQTQAISWNELGAGSRILHGRTKKVSEILRTSGTNPRYGEILYQLIKYYKCNQLLELGTSLGVATSYMCSAVASNSPANLYTLEGNSELLNFTKANFSRFFPGNNIQFIHGNFDLVLPGLLQTINTLDLVFIDGNHTYEATMNYFNLISPKLHQNSLVIIDDIYWSNEMKQAWNEIKLSPKVYATVDLFRWGLVIFKQDMQKEDFTIRFDGFLQAQIF